MPMHAKLDKKSARNQKDVLQDARDAMKANDPEALTKIARAMTTQIRERAYMVEPLLVVANRLAAHKGYYRNVAVRAFQAAARWATKKDQERRASEAILKYECTLGQRSERIKALGDVITHSDSGSPLQEKAQQKLATLLAQKPVHPLARRKHRSRQPLPGRKGAEKFCAQFGG